MDDLNYELDDDAPMVFSDPIGGDPELESRRLVREASWIARQLRAAEAGMRRALGDLDELIDQHLAASTD